MKLPSRKEIQLLSQKYKEFIVGIEYIEDYIQTIFIYYYNINQDLPNIYQNPYLNTIYAQLPMHVLEITREDYKFYDISYIEHSATNIKVKANNTIFNYTLINNTIIIDNDTIKKFIPAKDSVKLFDNYITVSDGINIVTGTKYLYTLPDEDDVLKIIYKILFSKGIYNYFINPYHYEYIHNLMCVNLDIITKEFYNFQNQNTPYLTLSNTYSIPFENAVKWIEMNNIITLNKKDYNDAEGYANAYSTDTWIFIPIYLNSDTSELSRYFLNTLCVLSHIPNIKMAGFMILKKHAEIEWHKHKCDTTIIHYTLSKDHDNKIEYYAAGEDISQAEKIDMTEYFSICCFKTSNYHHTVNKSSTDRISFVIELF